MINLKRLESKYISPKTTNLVYVVTGVTSGIGKALVIELAKKGATIAAVGRNPEKIKKLIEELKLSGIPEENINKINWFIADLSVMASIVNVASKIRDSYNHIDVLINNVGGYFAERKVTEDGFEYTLALNYLGHVLMTFLLLGKIQESESGNIINLSSSEHKHGKIHFDDLNLSKSFFGRKAYSQSKLADMLFIRELSLFLQDTNIRINAIHPGIVKTNIAQTKFGLQSLAFKLLKNTIAIEPAKAASRILELVYNPDFANLKGNYISGNKIRSAQATTYDHNKREELWIIAIDILKEWFYPTLKEEDISLKNHTLQYIQKKLVKNIPIVKA